MLVNKLVPKAGIDCTELQPFLIHPDLIWDNDRPALLDPVSGKWVLGEAKQADEIINAPPFELFSVEFENEFPLANDSDHQIRCVITQELAPGEYKFIAYVSNRHHHNMVMVYHVDPTHQPLYGHLVNVVDVMTGLFNDHRRAQVRMPGKGRFKDANGRKKEFRPTNTVYVYPKRAVKLQQTVTGRPIKPMSKHWVRGHWRRLANPDSMGKNRKGERVVKGWTWVKHYTKGDQGEAESKVRKVRK